MTASKDDYTLDPIDFEPTKVKLVDEAFAEAEEPLNMLVDFNNTLNEALLSVYSAVGKVSGALYVSTVMGKDVDFVLLSLTNKAGKPVTSDAAKAAREKVGEESKALGTALDALQALLEGMDTPASLTADADGKVASEDASVGDAITAVNEAVAAMRKALPDMKLGVSIKPAAVPGALAVLFITA